MAGELRALLRKSTAQALREAALPTVPLASGSGLVLVPLTEEIVASVVPTAADEAPIEGFYELTKELAEWAGRRSVRRGHGGQRDAALVGVDAGRSGRRVRCRRPEPSPADRGLGGAGSPVTAPRRTRRSRQTVHLTLPVLRYLVHG